MRYLQYRHTLSKIDTIIHKIEGLSLCLDNDLGEEALNCFDKFLELREAYRSRYRESRRKELSRKSVIEYAKQGLTMQEIADATGMSYSHIQRTIKSLGIEVNRQTTPNTSQRNKEIYELRKQGKTLQEIGDLYGIQRERVRQICNSIKRKELKL